MRMIKMHRQIHIPTGQNIALRNMQKRDRYSLNREDPRIHRFTGAGPDLEKLTQERALLLKPASYEPPLYTQPHMAGSLAKIAASLLITLAPSLNGCMVPPRLAAQGVTKAEMDKNPLRYIGDFGSIDDYIKHVAETGETGALIQMVLLYPGDYVCDAVRGGKAVVIDIPQEAYRRMQKQMGVKPKKEREGPARILMAPLDLLGGAVDVAAGSVLFVGNYAVVVVEGTVDQVTKRPFETAAHILFTYGIGKALDYNRPSGHSDTGTPPTPPFPVPPAAPFPAP